MLNFEFATRSQQQHTLARKLFRMARRRLSYTPCLSKYLFIDIFSGVHENLKQKYRINRIKSNKLTFRHILSGLCLKHRLQDIPETVQPLELLYFSNLPNLRCSLSYLTAKSGTMCTVIFPESRLLYCARHFGKIH